MTEYTPAQLEAWAGLGPWCQPDGPEYGVMLDRVPSRPIHSFLGQPIFDKQPHDDWFEQEMANATLIAAAPDLARLVLEKDAEIARLKGLAWIAFHEFNAINARSGGPLDHYGMVTVTHEYWQAITDLFAKAAGETTPWPTENAKAIFEEINRQAMKETSDD